MRGVGRELFSLTLDRLQDLPEPCVSCVFWELDPALVAGSIAGGEPGLDKESWLSSALLEWGSVGQILYVDGVPAGYITYAPSYLVPRAAAFPTAPIGADAVMLMTARVIPQFGGQGLGRVLIQASAKDVMRRGVRAVEAFGYLGDPGSAKAACVIPARFLTAVGFKTVREHRTYPRLRLDLHTALTWRVDMEAAVERLLAAVRSPSLGQGRRASGVDTGAPKASSA
ncbi:MAG: GNAT family N-acetyltransferase [Actinomycetota bacterium]